MQKGIVQFTEKEYRDFKIMLAEELVKRAERPGGFTIVSKETGKPINDRLLDWMVGTLVVAWDDVEERIEG